MKIFDLIILLSFFLCISSPLLFAADNDCQSKLPDGKYHLEMKDTSSTVTYFNGKFTVEGNDIFAAFMNFCYYKIDNTKILALSHLGVINDGDTLIVRDIQNYTFSHFPGDTLKITNTRGYTYRVKLGKRWIAYNCGDVLGLFEKLGTPHWGTRPKVMIQKFKLAYKDNNKFVYKNSDFTIILTKNK